MAERFSPSSMDRTWRLLDRWIEEDRCPAVGAVIGSSQEVSAAKLVGRQRVQGNEPIRDDAIFLIASPTKPVVAMALMLLVERGEVLLADRIDRYVPRFGRHRKRAITVRHCLTHTSGLPDMVPGNTELRAEGAPLSEFLGRILELKPDFKAGHSVQYQSTGFLLLSEVIRKVSGQELPEFLRQNVLEPLGMRDTTLGMPPEWEQAEQPRVERIAEIRLSRDEHGNSSCWNTPYWRRLGAPWGGLLSTPADLGRLCQHLLGIHAGQEGILSPAAVEAMTTNQLHSMPDVPESDRRAQPWGLGWRMNWPAHASSFGDLLSSRAYGHWGATGTMVWIDPARDAFAVLLSTEPLDTGAQNTGFNRLASFSNSVCAAIR